VLEAPRREREHHQAEREHDPDLSEDRHRLITDREREPLRSASRSGVDVGPVRDISPFSLFDRSAPLLPRAAGSTWWR
jgi:hypothetical protein